MLGAGPGTAAPAPPGRPFPAQNCGFGTLCVRCGWIRALLDGSGAGTASFRHERGAHTRGDGPGLAPSNMRASVCVRALSGKRTWHLFLLV